MKMADTLIRFIDEKKNSNKINNNNIMKFTYLIIAILILSSSCQLKSFKKGSLKLGFGKADLTQAAIFDDPLINGDTYKLQHKYDREEKFAISDRIKGRWRAGSGMTRKLVDSLSVEALYGEDVNGAWVIVTLDECFLLYNQVDAINGKYFYC